MHVHDNHGVTDEHILPMMGTIEWRSIMQALREINYTGDFVYESAQPTKHLPEDDILRKEMIRYSVTLGNYMLNQL
jgi:sugar phosphate isomerase/epimerase